MQTSTSHKALLIHDEQAEDEEVDDIVISLSAEARRVCVAAKKLDTCKCQMGIWMNLCRA